MLVCQNINLNNPDKNQTAYYEYLQAAYLSCLEWIKKYSLRPEKIGSLDFKNQ